MLLTWETCPLLWYAIKFKKLKLYYSSWPTWGQAKDLHLADESRRWGKEEREGHSRQKLLVGLGKDVVFCPQNNGRHWCISFGGRAGGRRETQPDLHLCLDYSGCWVEIQVDGAKNVWQGDHSSGLEILVIWTEDDIGDGEERDFWRYL